LPGAEHVGDAKDMRALGAFNNITMVCTKLVGASCIGMNQKNFVDGVYVHPQGGLHKELKALELNPKP